MGISGAELFNMFAKSLDKQFNGTTNSVVVNGRRLYNYDPSALRVHVDGTGIWFSFNFKAESDFCDPSVSVTGTFTFDTNVNGTLGLSPRWINPVNASLDWGWCAALVDIPLLGVIADVAYLAIGDNGAGASVQSTLTDQIASSVPNLGNGALFLDGTTTSADLLSVKMKLPMPSVEIAVPYDAFDMGRTATRVPAGQTVTLLATGLGMNDTVARVAPQTTLLSGPNGVPLDTPTLLPNMRKVARTADLVDSGASVAQLLASTSSVTSMSRFRYKPGCSVTSPGGHLGLGVPQIRFGVNDTASDAARLRALSAQGYSVRMFFGSGGSSCVGTSSGIVSSAGTVLTE